MVQVWIAYDDALQGSWQVMIEVPQCRLLGSGARACHFRLNALPLQNHILKIFLNHDQWWIKTRATVV